MKQKNSQFLGMQYMCINLFLLVKFEHVMDIRFLIQHVVRTVVATIYETVVVI